MKNLKIYNFCCIICPWELYLIEFDLYFIAKPKYETYKRGNTIHMEAIRDILLDNDYNKVMSLYTQRTIQ